MSVRSPTLALAFLGACLAACFTDNGAPALPTDPATADMSVGPTADPGTTTAPSTTASTTDTTTGDPTTTGTAEATSTGCVPESWYFDIDKDGYGGPMKTEKCGWPGPGYFPDSLDCNDIDVNINPAAVEACDALDNDCDGGIDEYPATDMQGGCNGCASLVGAGSTYYFCSLTPLGWDDARAHCMTLLGDLIVTSDVMERDFIYGQITDLKVRWWVGLSDRATEGLFEWVDASAFDPGLPFWNNGEPNNVDSNFNNPANCVDIGDTGWRDQSCAETQAFICEAPLPS